MGPVLVRHLLPVAHPVVVPTVERVRVVTADRLNRVDLEASDLQLLHVPVEGGGGVGTGEDVLGHEETPRDVLPVRALRGVMLFVICYFKTGW